MKSKIAIRLVNSLEVKDQPYEIVDTEIKGFLLRVQPSGIMAYYLSYRTQEGRRRRIKLGKCGSLTVVQARDLAQSMMAKVMMRQDVQQEKQHAKLAAEKSRMNSLAYFLDEKYGPWVQAERKTGLDTLRRIKANFKRHLFTPLEKIDTWLVEKWRAEQLKQGKLATTVNRDIT